MSREARHEYGRKFAEKGFPVLISFPRSGKHWTLFLIEEYFQRPARQLSSYFPGRTDFIIGATHDVKCKSEKKNIVYLYRNPVDIMFSYMNFQDGASTEADLDKKIINYSNHLRHYLLDETHTEKKVVVRYETLKDDFSKIVKFLNQEPDLEKIENTFNKITKAEMSKYLDTRTLKTSEKYQEDREVFRKKYGDYIINKVLEIEPRLENLIKKPKPF